MVEGLFKTNQQNKNTPSSKGPRDMEVCKVGGTSFGLGDSIPWDRVSYVSVITKSPDHEKQNY